MKRLNNKGYMLVEIIMAFVITFGLLYFMMELVIKLKNKNDDLMVETIVRTDQAIVANKIMNCLASEDIGSACDCYNASDENIISDYADIGGESCNIDNNVIHIKIPIKVKQIKDKNFDIDLYYKYDIATLPDDD